jgi:hypothetical protein
MNKLFLSTLVAALVCVAVTSAKAANGISSSTLDKMGLSSLSMMTDTEALAVRGKGWVGGGNHSFGCKDCGPRGGAPSSKAFGNSFATINLPENCPDCQPTGGSHSENGYLAMGPYAASGTNYSEAGAIISKAEIVDIDGVVKSVTNICTTKVFAGGSSSAMSF